MYTVNWSRGVWIHRLFGMVNRSREEVHLPWVYVHSSICETYAVGIWSIGGGGHSIDLWSICGTDVKLRYSIVVEEGFQRSTLGMVNMWRSGVPGVNLRRGRKTDVL